MVIVLFIEIKERIMVAYDGIAYLLTPNTDLYRLNLENEGQIVGILVVLKCAEIEFL